jgi:acyl transferase domain-containing protein
LAIVAPSIAELSDKLTAYTAGQIPVGLFQGKVQTYPLRDASLSAIAVELAGDSPVAQTVHLSLAEALGTQLTALRLDRQGWQDVLYRLAQVYVQGASIDWISLEHPYSRRKVILPTYPFQQQHYGIDLT